MCNASKRVVESVGRRGLGGRTFCTYLQMLEVLFIVKDGIVGTVDEISTVMERSTREVFRYIGALNKAGASVFVDNTVVSFGDTFSLLPCFDVSKEVVAALEMASVMIARDMSWRSECFKRIVGELSGMPDVKRLAEGDGETDFLTGVDRLAVWDYMMRMDRFPTVAQIAKSVGVSAKTCRRDISDMVSLGLSIEFCPVEKGYFYRDPEHYVASVVISKSDVRLLAVARDLLFGEGSSDYARAARSISTLMRTLEDLISEYMHKVCLESAIEEVVAICRLSEKVYPFESGGISSVFRSEAEVGHAA